MDRKSFISFLKNSLPRWPSELDMSSPSIYWQWTKTKQGEVVAVSNDPLCLPVTKQDVFSN